MKRIGFRYHSISEKIAHLKVRTFVKHSRPLSHYFADSVRKPLGTGVIELLICGFLTRHGMGSNDWSVHWGYSSLRPAESRSMA
jgi:hypothetical protein